MADPCWNLNDDRQVRWWSQHVLTPFILASRCRDFTDEAITYATAKVWMRTLIDVPMALVLEGVDAMLGVGVKFMPRPGELREAVDARIADRRRSLADRALALKAECVHCQGSGFQSFIDDAGVERVRRCQCHRMALALYEGVPERLALPPAGEVEP